VVTGMTMNPEERRLQQRLRFIAALHRFEVAKLEMAAAAIQANAALRGLGAALKAHFDLELAEHPDMAELNVQLDGFYGEVK
jgi:hypothetical protein